MKRRISPRRGLSLAAMPTWFLLVACPLLLVATVEAAQIEQRDGVTIVSLSGTPYELGRQHGEVLRSEVHATVSQVLGYFRRYLKIPWVRFWAANWWLDLSWRQAQPFIPADDLQELKGLSDGSGVPLGELYRFHAIPDRTYACSTFAAWGRATIGGRLIHMRNLDWNIQAGIQQFPIVFVVHPNGKRAFVSVGWAGFIGVLTGINDAGLSIGQVGAGTVEATFRGEPMVFVMRRVLEEANSVQHAEAVIRHAHRTVGVNYVVADAKAKRAIALETTHKHVRVFEANDPAERGVGYARPMVDAVFRADTAIDPLIRDQQIASHGEPSHPGVEDPTGSSAYDIRYLGQAAGLAAHFGTLDTEAAQRIAQAIAPPSNVQSVIFAWPDLWVANAQGTTPAAQTSYHHLNVQQLLDQSSH